jgi:hypothetical protein
MYSALLGFNVFSIIGLSELCHTLKHEIHYYVHCPEPFEFSKHPRTSLRCILILLDRLRVCLTSGLLSESFDWNRIGISQFLKRAASPAHHTSLVQSSERYLMMNTNHEASPPVICSRLLHFLSLYCKYFPQDLEHFQFMFFPLRGAQVSHSCITTSRILVLYILNFMFHIGDMKMKDSELMIQAFLHLKLVLFLN